MRKLAIGLALGLALSVGVARAAIPDASGVIHGCIKTAAPNKGALRVVDSERRLVNGRWVVEKCLETETPLNWRQD